MCKIQARDELKPHWKPGGIQWKLYQSSQPEKLLDYRDSMYHLLSDKLEPMEI